MEHQLVGIVVAYRHVLKVDALFTQAGNGHALQLKRVAQRWHVGNKVLSCFDAELRLGGARLCATRKPGKLTANFVLTALFGDAGHAIALDALHDVG